LNTRPTGNHWLTDKTVSPTLRTLFNGLRRYPYFADLDETQENTFILSRFRLNEPTHASHQREVAGLANAWLLNTLAVSFCSHEVWAKPNIGLTVEQETIETTQQHTRHACTASALNDAFKEWFRKRHLPTLSTHDHVDAWFPPEKYALTPQAKDDLISMFQRQQHKLIHEIENLLKEIWIAPLRGTGKPKTLQGNLAGWMSRRITDKHRLVYKLDIPSQILHIYRCYEHYDDK
jgi:toxin YoeB